MDEKNQEFLGRKLSIQTLTEMMQLLNLKKKADFKFGEKPSFNALFGFIGQEVCKCKESNRWKNFSSFFLHVN